MGDGPTQLVGLLGRGLVPADQAIIIADDLGFTRGDGCFDATRVRGGGAGAVIDHLDLHLERFAASAARLGLPEPDSAQWRALIGEVVGAWRHDGEATLKIMLTRGAESSPGTTTGVLTLTRASSSFAQARQGIGVVTLSRGHAADAFADAPWLLGGVKSLSYAVNAAAKREASARGADDALFVSTDGYALEGTTSALIVRVGERLVTTPTGPTGILASVTQQVLFEAARAEGVDCGFELLSLDEVRAADGAWLASSVRGVCPVLQLDGMPLKHDPAWSSRVAEFAGF
ncbi:MAG: aminodeoxychorismate lyase [Micropruina sp.]|nr:aminodeoxychorismate lyase [Micropruina sp.]